MIWLHSRPWQPWEYAAWLSCCRKPIPLGSPPCSYQGHPSPPPAPNPCHWQSTVEVRFLTPSCRMQNVGSKNSHGPGQKFLRIVLWSEILSSWSSFLPFLLCWCSELHCGLTVLPASCFNPFILLWYISPHKPWHLLFQSANPHALKVKLPGQPGILLIWYLHFRGKRQNIYKATNMWLRWFQDSKDYSEENRTELYTEEEATLL